MIPLIVITLIVGVILGQFLGGALRAVLVVGAVVLVLGFVSTHFDVDVRSWIGDGIKAGSAAVDEFRPTKAPTPIRPGIREARRWM